MNKWLNFGGDLNHYWELRKVVNGHKSAAHTDWPDDGTGKTCLGGGMHCPSASNYDYYYYRTVFQAFLF